MIRSILITLMAGFIWAGHFLPSHAQDGLYGQIYMTAAYCRAGAVEADGRMLDPRQNPPLYALLGNVFGGDGTNEFAVPDLRSRGPIGMGLDPDRHSIDIGAKVGSDQATLRDYPSHDHAEVGHTHSLPPHTHDAALNAASSGPNQKTPQGHALATFTRGSVYATDTPPYGRMAEGAVQTSQTAGVRTNEADGLYGTTSVAGSGTPVDIRDPFLGIKFCIVTNGTFPSRP